MVEAIHRQLDRCDVCGSKTHKKDLVYTQVRYLKPLGSNYFDYSYYDGTFWANDGNATEQSESKGLGPDSEDCRAKIASDNTITEIKGSKTFLLDTSPTTFYTASSVDISGFTSLCFGVYVGPYHDNDDPAEITVSIGNCNSDASVLYELREVTGIRNGRHIWVHSDIADLNANVTTSAAYFYVKVSATSDEDFYFWVDWFQLEKDAERPGAFISTSGSSDALTSETKVMRSAKVCHNCRERLTLESEQYGRPRFDFEDPIEYDIQEF